MTRKSLYLGAALLGLVGMAGVVLTACSKSGQHEKDPNISHYTCPMHPQIHKDHPGDCPICGMKLVPVYREAVPEGGKESSPPTPSPASMQERGNEGVRISPERQQLIGLKTGTVIKGSAQHAIRTVGFVHRDLSQAAGSGPVLIDANLYPADAALVKPGTEAVVLLPYGKELAGRVRTVDAVINPATRSLRAQVEVPQGRDVLRQNYLQVLFKVDLGEVLTIPRSAVIDTGERQVAFAVKEGQRFEQRTIQTGLEAGNDAIVVLEGLTEGETVVTSAAFLVDSESRLKSAATSPSTPSCPEGEYWDVGMAMCMPKTGS